jgi:hypothetical protein
MVKLINYNALRTLTTPFMIKIYIILVLLGICYAFHYRNQIQGIAIKNNTTQNIRTTENTNNKNNTPTEEGFQSTNDKLEVLKLEQKNAVLEDQLNEYQRREALQLKKLSRKVKDDKNAIKKTLYESTRSNDTENNSYLSEMSKLTKQYTDFENKKLTVYNQALSDNIEAEKKNRYNINLLNIGNNIEKGLVNIVEDLGEVIEGPSNNTEEGFASYTNRRRKAVAKMSNEGKLEDWEGRDGKVGLTPTNKVEGFANNGTKSNKTSKKNKSNKNDPLDIAKDFLEYMLTTVKDVSLNVGGETAKDLLKVLTKDENMISSGILMLIVSIGLYFIDISS